MLKMIKHLRKYWAMSPKRKQMRGPSDMNNSMWFMESTSDTPFRFAMEFESAAVFLVLWNSGCTLRQLLKDTLSLSRVTYSISVILSSEVFYEWTNTKYNQGEQTQIALLSCAALNLKLRTNEHTSHHNIINCIGCFRHSYTYIYIYIYIYI